jgi:integrase
LKVTVTSDDFGRPRRLAEVRRCCLALAKVRRATVSARLAAIADANGKTAADRARAALSAFFTWAIREGLADANPVGFTNKSTDGKSRDRVLSDSEIAAIWRALPEKQFGAIVRLLILTGARREEVGGLRWSEINGDKIALPGERTKNGRPLDLPLSGAAAAIIEAQPRRADRDLIFGERDGPFQGYSKSKATLDAALDIVAQWRLHDIRRTVTTRMADLGVQPHVIEALLNHVSGYKVGVAEPTIVRSTAQRNVARSIFGPRMSSRSSPSANRHEAPPARATLSMRACFSSRSRPRMASHPCRSTFRNRRPRAARGEPFAINGRSLSEENCYCNRDGAYRII